MRQVVLDTETTGLDTNEHRIVEIGCIALLNRRESAHYHCYVNPEREVDKGAYDVHGISNEFLAEQPVFADIVRAFLDFIEGSELIIHNAPFDVSFINNELQLLGQEWGSLEDYCTVFDTLAFARERYPAMRNSLDALCERHDIDNSQRDLHGALKDAQLLLEVYLAMTSGQIALTLEESGGGEIRRVESKRSRLPVIQPNEEELVAHERKLALIQQESNGNCIFLK